MPNYQQDDMVFEGDGADTYCRNQGFIQEPCPAGEVPVAYCSASDKYHKCDCDWTVYKYNSAICPPNSTPSNNVCKSYSDGCVCNEAGYVWNEDSNRCEFRCSSDADCGDGKVCNDSDGQCYGCLDDGDCGEGNVCRNNVCKAEDKCENVTCSGGQSCNPDNGLCECPSGQVWHNEKCEKTNCQNGGVTCSGSTPICTAGGDCVECEKDSDCGSSGTWSCVNNQCKTTDLCKDVTCSGGKLCNSNNGLCECPSGTKDFGDGICETPNCVNGGVTCENGQVCNQSTKQCENGSPSKETCIAAIKAQDSDVVFVANLEDWRKNVSYSTKKVILLASLDVSGESNIVGATTRDYFSLESYNDNLWSPSKDGRLPACKDIYSSGIALTAENIDVSANKQVTFYVQVNAKSAAVQGSRNNRALLEFKKMARLTSLEQKGTESSTIFSGDGYVGSFKNNATSSNLIIHGSDRLVFARENNRSLMRPVVIVEDMNVGGTLNLDIREATLSTHYFHAYGSNYANWFNVSVTQGNWYLSGGKINGISTSNGFKFYGADDEWQFALHSGCLVDNTALCRFYASKVPDKCLGIYDMLHVPGFSDGIEKDIEFCKQYAHCYGSKNYITENSENARPYYCGETYMDFATFTTGNSCNIGCKTCTSDDYVIGVGSNYCIAYSGNAQYFETDPYAQQFQ